MHNHKYMQILQTNIYFLLPFFFCADLITKPTYCDIFSNIFPLSGIEQPNIYNSTHFLSATLFAQCKLCRVHGCSNSVMLFKNKAELFWLIVEMIIEAWKDHKEIANIMVFLQDKGASPAFAVKIYKR